MRFLVDSMLGRLCRGLRLAGFDAVYAGPDAPAALRARAAAEGRILVTRRRMTGEGIAVVSSDLWQDQLRQLSRRLGLKGHAHPFTRCLVCNAALRPVLDRQEVRTKAPFHVRQTQKRFMLCDNCGRAYWPGTHRQAMEKMLERCLE